MSCLKYVLSSKLQPTIEQIYSLCPINNLQKSSPYGIDYIFSHCVCNTCIQEQVTHPLDLCKIFSLGARSSCHLGIQNSCRKYDI